MEPVVGAVAVGAGVSLLVLGVMDVFLTILHPDRDGPVSVGLNRATWKLAVLVGRTFPRAAPELLAAAGGAMIAGTILLWMGLFIVGFALLAWPFLTTSFALPAGAPGSFVDALYWSGITFTTLGYGDVLPVSPVWKALALAEAISGFALVGAGVAFLLSVYQGIEQRDEMALRIYSETRRSWDGAAFVLRVLDQEGKDALQAHVKSWAEGMRRLHERLYRFQPLAFYVRTRSEKHHPERMLQAVGEVAVAARVLAQARGLEGLLPAADEIDIAYTEFMASAMRHHGTARAIAAIERPQPTAEDLASVRRIREVLERSRRPQVDELPGEDDEQAVILAARLRIFLDELDRITRWRLLRDLA